MNNFEKQVNKTHNTNKIQKWWRNNGYKVMRVILFPIWFCICLHEKYENYLYDREATFTPARAEKFLDKYLPAVVDIVDGKWWFCIQWRHVYRTKKRKDKVFQMRHYDEINEYLQNDYEIEGYTKSIDGTEYETWVIFTKNEDE